MTTTIKLEPSSLNEVWDTIKPCLETMKLDWPELGTWRVEDVYASIKAEESVVYVTEDGFAVCRPTIDEFNGEGELFIWIAYSFKPGGNMIKKYLPSFIEVARHLGYKAVTTRSNHPALTKIPELEVVYTEYRVLVDESTS